MAIQIAEKIKSPSGTWLVKVSLDNREAIVLKFQARPTDNQVRTLVEIYITLRQTARTALRKAARLSDEIEAFVGFVRSNDLTSYTNAELSKIAKDFKNALT